MKQTHLVLCVVAVVLSSAQAFFPAPHYGHKPSHHTKANASSVVTVESKEPMVFNFSIPKDKPFETCLKVKMSFSVDIDYFKVNETTKTTQRFELGNINDYAGECNATINILKVIWRDSWTLHLNYTLTEKTYQLDAISLNYIVDDKFFPNASDSQKGNQVIMATNLGLFSTLTGNSFKCRSDTRIVSNDERSVMIIKNYHGQPFMSGENGKPRDFGTAVECIGDQLNANKLVPIIVGSVLFALILIIIISYFVGRRKRRSSPGYQQV